MRHKTAVKATAGILSAALLGTLYFREVYQPEIGLPDPRGIPGQFAGDVWIQKSWQNKRYLRLKIDERIYEMCDNEPWDDIEPNQSKMDAVNVYDSQGYLTDVFRHKFPDYLEPSSEAFQNEQGHTLPDNLWKELNKYYSRNWRGSKLRPEPYLPKIELD